MVSITTLPFLVLFSLTVPTHGYCHPYSMTFLQGVPFVSAAGKQGYRAELAVAITPEQGDTPYAVSRFT